MNTGKFLNVLAICLTLASTVVSAIHQDKKIEEYIDKKLGERE